MLYIFPAIFIAGAIAQPLGILVGTASLLYLLRIGKHDSAILLLLVILLFGDTRNYYMLFAKPLRIVYFSILTAYSLWEFRLGRYKIQKLFLLMLPFLTVSILGMVFSPVLDLAIQKTVAFIMLYFIGLHYIFYRFKEYHIVLLADIMMLCHLVFFIGLLLLPVFPDVVSYGGVRYNGLLGNPNGMGLYCVLVTPITMYVFEKRPQISKRYRNIAWTAIMLSLALCSSRNSIISTGIFLTMYFAFRGNTYKGVIFAAVIVPTVALFFFTVDLVELVEALGLERYLRIRDIESGSGRVFAWDHGLELIKQNPIIGCGFACEEYNFIYKMNYRLYITGHQGGVHNSYLAFLINTGIAGTLLFFGFLTALARLLRPLRLTFPMVVSFAISAIFESWLFSSLNPFHIILVCFMVFLIADRQTVELIESRLAEREVEPNIAFIS